MQQLENIAAKRATLLGQYEEIIARNNESRTKVVEQLGQLLAQAKLTLAEKGDRVYVARTKEEAQQLLITLCQGQEKVVRINSPELHEIDFDVVMAQQGITVALSDLGEIICDQLDVHDYRHPILTNLDQISHEQIIEALQGYVGGDAIDNAGTLAKLAHYKIREQIVSSDYGVTGINGIIAENGTLILAENEGNGRAVSNLPYRHIIVAGYDRLYQSAEEGVRAIQSAYIWGLGKNNPAYYSLISGPSRTADIEFRMAYGMHGPLEVHLILLDNGRQALLDQGCGSLLKCIDCGACYQSLYSLAKCNGWQEECLLTMKNIGLQLIRQEIDGLEGIDEVAEFQCPVGITIGELTKIKR